MVTPNHAYIGPSKIDLTADTNTIYTHPAEIQCNASTEINSLKSSVSNGKTLIANAITGKGVTTSSSATFATMASNINSLNVVPNLPIVEVTTDSAASYSIGQYVRLESKYRVSGLQFILLEDAVVGYFENSRDYYEFNSIIINSDGTYRTGSMQFGRRNANISSVRAYQNNKFSFHYRQTASGTTYEGDEYYSVNASTGAITAISSSQIDSSYTNSSPGYSATISSIMMPTSTSFALMKYITITTPQGSYQVTGGAANVYSGTSVETIGYNSVRLWNSHGNIFCMCLTSGSGPGHATFMHIDPTIGVPYFSNVVSPKFSNYGTYMDQLGKIIDKTDTTLKLLIQTEWFT